MCEKEVFQMRLLKGKLLDTAYFITLALVIWGLWYFLSAHFFEWILLEFILGVIIFVITLIMLPFKLWNTIFSWVWSKDR